VRTPTERFLALMAGPTPAVRLDEAALLLAAHGEQGLDVEAQMARLDELAGSCPDPSVDGVVELLFGRLQLRGNTDDYGDPRNSFLDQVLDRRLGIPITLSVLVMEIGRRVGLTFEGIGMPGHFLVRHVGVPAVVLDPFHGGRRLELEDAETLFRLTHGPGVPFSAELLAPSPPRAILARMLFNLQHSYRGREDGTGLAWVGRLLAGMPGVRTADVVETARLVLNTGRFREAADIFESLAERSEPADAERLRARAVLLRARLN
jgi:regulator of sirC expression with transglutaminase-like and TPR domain